MCISSKLGYAKFRVFNLFIFQNVGNETSFIADHENVKKSAFDWLAAKLWLKESTILWNVCTLCTFE